MFWITNKEYRITNNDLPERTFLGRGGLKIVDWRLKIDDWRLMIFEAGFKTQDSRMGRSRNVVGHGYRNGFLEFGAGRLKDEEILPWLIEDWRLLIEDWWFLKQDLGFKTQDSRFKIQDSRIGISEILLATNTRMVFRVWRGMLEARRNAWLSYLVEMKWICTLINE